jgi:hypothetical protein
MSAETCPNCGEAIDDETLKFCTSCGLRLFPDDEAIPTSPTAEVDPESPVDQTVIVNRTRTSPFLPPPLPSEEVTPVVSRAWVSRGSGRKAQLSRERKMAGGLPEWEPLPPGELLVKRAKRK